MAKSNLTKTAQHMLEVLENAHKVEEQALSISEQLLKVAKECKSKDEYLACVSQAEREYRADHGTDILPACWKKPKSVIKKAFEKGIDIKKFDTESALRKEVYPEKPKGKTEGEEGKGTTTAAQDAHADKAGATGHTVLNEALQGIIHQLKALEKVGPEHEAEAVARAEVVLANANAELVDIVNEFTDIVGGTVQETQQKTQVA